MLEFNQWFFVLAANFLILLFILNKILFQPLLKVFKEREEAIDGSLDAAKEMELKKDESLEKMKAELAAAAQKAREAFDELKGQGQAKQKELLEAANAEASKVIGEARGKLKAEADRARGALKGDVEKFSEEIVNKLIKA
jgi:F-type H+-transporting ATPase subunit b